MLGPPPSYLELSYLTCGHGLTATVWTKSCLPVAHQSAVGGEDEGREREGRNSGGGEKQREENALVDKERRSNATRSDTHFQSVTQSTAVVHHKDPHGRG